MITFNKLKSGVKKIYVKCKFLLIVKFSCTTKADIDDEDEYN